MMSRAFNDDNTFAARNNTANDKVTEQIIHYMLNNFDESISLQQVAEHFGYEACYFSKLFRRLLGDSYMVYRNRIRVEIAILFLRTTTKSISDITWHCGFSTVRNFNRVFRNVAGFAPSEVRNMTHDEFEKYMYISDKQVSVRKIVQQEFSYK